MILDPLLPLPQAVIPEGYRLATYPRSQSITKFRQLYDDSFRGLPWYQPFSSNNEVAAELVDADDLLFLEHNYKQVGFLWMHISDEISGEIEPLGISIHYQGRSLSRPFLIEILLEARKQLHNFFRLTQIVYGVGYGVMIPESEQRR